jgi:DNA-binding CsgD family transcriptional regulator/tetratricopeptide (TPR) repeat protein
VILERDEELATLSRLLDDLDSSGGKVVLVRGEAGIGKSALVREFTAAHADEAHVYSGSCDDLLTPQPLGPFWDIARDEASLTGPLASADRPGLLDAVLDLVSGSLRPNIMVIEDTHWADEATLDAIKYLGRRIARTNGLLVLTYRDGEVDTDHPLRRVIGDLPPQSVVRLRLGGLSLSAVSAIISESSLIADEVHAVTNGNPFLVTEMAASGDDAVPSSVQDSVMSRAWKLSPEARDVLKALSVIPERISRIEISDLCGPVESELDECERRGLLEVGADSVAFRHELIRRAVVASMTISETVAANRRVLEVLPPETNPARLVHHAREASDIDQLVELTPVAARAAAAVGSHREAAQHFRRLRLHLERLDPVAKGPILRDWARQELLVDDIPEAIRLIELALRHYEEAGDVAAVSGVLADAAHFYENAGQRMKALESAGRALDVLGPDADGSDLARALEANGYLAMMAGDIAGVTDFVDRTLAAAGPDIDERIIIRSLNHKGIVTNIANYPDGRVDLDEARERAEAAGQWYEECRALFNHAWAAAESRDLPIASDYVRRGIASSVRHELPGLEGYAIAMHARVLELQGRWDEAEDLAREQFVAAEITRMVGLPVIGIIEARTGRHRAASTLKLAWDLSVVADEFQRLGPVAMPVAEHAWITGEAIVPAADIKRVMKQGIDMGFSWTPGSIAMWLWKIGELAEPPSGIAEPYRLVIEGEPSAAAAMWSEIGCPYERAIALSHGDQASQLAALDALESLGATAVAAKLRQALRDQGVSVPRGRGQKTRDHPAGLTARQAEVLQLLDEGLSNLEMADRLFVSPRTVENHVSAVLAKLDAATREEAVSRAQSAGLLTA